ncbi:DUF1045 domain-containing protein [Roseibium sp. RKSG952]|uniref:DUF1045 domain-containing protein n=1 Tax=Roseibium sp. RKSG952 TaxID=2529384 RepID=UPI0012BD18C8|nr:DUF1045 domain-containing protein [Roseibium sp. RKSG952]MTH98178.1 DUF1045 domain-containing protein [Roseibium sp. RKSG952]
MRYAIYFAADQKTPLMTLGNGWLGRDPFAGTALEQPRIRTLSPDRLKELTADPRRYGFHGTLKAPFSLRDDVTETDLLKACERFSSQISGFGTSGLTVAELHGFLALIPAADSPELSAFAAACVRFFEPCRAPLAGEDLARRRKSPLTPAQDRNLADWGYPYIFEDFRFHMTLSNKVENDDERSKLKAAAEAHFSTVTGKPMTIGSFALYVEENRRSPFHVHTHFQLKGPALPSAASEQLFKEQV